MKAPPARPSNHGPKSTIKLTATKWGLFLVVLAIIALPHVSARAHGEAVEVVVEGLARGGEDLGVVDYGISVDFVDGDAMTGADLEVSVEPADEVDVEPVVETVAGVYIGRVHYPGAGEWRVTVSFESPDSTGSVQFTQTIVDPVPEAPVVLVDTLDPDRVGTIASDSTRVLGADSQEAEVGEHESPIVVEAFIETAEAPLSIDYAVLVEGSDGASLTLSAQSDQENVVDPVVLLEADGIHRTRVVYPAAALWTVTLDVEKSSGQETLTFQENLPWPHYTTEAGQPKVKYDSESPDRVGTIASEDVSVYFREASSVSGGDSTATTESSDELTTTSSTTPDSQVVAGDDDVVVNLTEPADELRLDIALRGLHVAAIGLWALPMLASLLGREYRLSVVSTLSGMVLTGITGVSLALWGAPVTFPGLLRWEELANRLYGDAYLIAFLAKMAVAGVAIVGTIVWASRRNKLAVFVTLGGLGAAVVAVIAMSQFHLFSHL